MKITLICVGKTDEPYLMEGINKYHKRVGHYIQFNLVVIPDIKNSKNLSQAQQKAKEAESIFKQIQPNDYVVLLDERGKHYTSLSFARFLEQKMLNSVPNLLFIIGGPYGFDQSLYDRAAATVSLSDMTFSHQMIRLFFTEQLYRAFTILKGEPYHHE